MVYRNIACAILRKHMQQQNIPVLCNLSQLAVHIRQVGKADKIDYLLASIYRIMRESDSFLTTFTPRGHVILSCLRTPDNGERLSELEKILFNRVGYAKQPDGSLRFYL